MISFLTPLGSNTTGTLGLSKGAPSLTQTRHVGTGSRRRAAMRNPFGRIVRSFLPFLEQCTVLQMWCLALVVHVLIYIMVGLTVDSLYPAGTFQSIRDPHELFNGVNVWILFAPTLWAYYRWLPQATLRMADVLINRGVVTNDFKVQLEAALSGHLHIAIAVPATIANVVLLVFIIVPSQTKAVGLVNFWYYTWWSSTIIYALAVINGLLLFALAIKAIRVARAISRVFGKTDAIRAILPYHPDQCGGFGDIGNYASRLASICVVIALSAAWYSLYPIVSGGTLVGAIPIASIIAYLAIVPFILPAFLWSPHRAMVAYRNAQLQSLSYRLADIQTRMMAASATANLGQLRSQLDDLEALHTTMDRELPLWPISTRARGRFIAFVSSPIVINLVTSGLRLFK